VSRARFTGVPQLRNRHLLAIIEDIGWFNHTRLHESLGDVPPVEFEQHCSTRLGAQAPISPNESVAAHLCGLAWRVQERSGEPFQPSYQRESRT